VTHRLLVGTRFDFRHRVALNAGFLIAAAAIGAFARDPFTGGVPWVAHPVMCALALVVCAFGIAIRATATGFLPFSIIASRSLHKQQLVTDGPYAVTRNPLYLGTWFALTSFGFVTNLWGLAFLATVVTVKVVRLVRYEEAQLRETFGAEYDAYAARVPLIFPRPITRVAEIFRAQTDWRYGLGGNIFLLGLLAGYAVAIAVPSLDVVLGMAALGLIGQAPFLRRDREKRKAETST